MAELTREEKKARRIVTAFLVAAIAILEFFVHFSTKKVGGEYFDLLGRKLEPVPTWAYFILGEEGMWSGPFWLFVDTIVFFGTLYLVYLVIFKKVEPEETGASCKS